MKTIAYLRVSKDSQDVRNQQLAILEFAQQAKLEIRHEDSMWSPQTETPSLRDNVRWGLHIELA